MGSNRFEDQEEVGRQKKRSTRSGGTRHEGKLPFIFAVTYF